MILKQKMQVGHHSLLISSKGRKTNGHDHLKYRVQEHVT